MAETLPTAEGGAGDGRLKRRGFIKMAGAAAVGGLVEPAGWTERGAAEGPRPQESASVRLGNAEPPALQFQPYPGGTGALLERLWSERGQPAFTRTEIEIEPWQGSVPDREEDLAFLPVSRLAALLRSRRISASELTELYLDRLRRYDPVLLCAVTILEDRAREEARRADAEIRAGRWRGPLHGIPYGVKDLFSVSGAPTTWGSSEFRARVIDQDAEVVVRLREAGAVLIAKLSTGVFARGDQWYRGRTRNPWNVDEGASGSSAGPGAATAAGCVAFAIGTETRGSIVSPARRNGVSALRPTFGRVSRHGGMVLTWSMDKVGPMCRSAEDCALVFHAIHGASELDPASLTAPFDFDRSADLEQLRVGFTEDAPAPLLSALTELGVSLRPMPPLPSGSFSHLDVEEAAAFDFRLAPGGGEPEPLSTALPQVERDRLAGFLRGREVRAIDYVNSERRRLLLMREMAVAMEDFDMFVSGSGETTLTNDTGHPAVVIPYDFGVRDPQSDSPTPMPLTAVIVGDLYSDDKVLNLAHAYQSGSDWHLRRPDLSGLG